MLGLLEARAGLLASLFVWPGWTRCGQSSVTGEAFHIVGHQSFTIKCFLSIDFAPACTGQ